MNFISANRNSLIYRSYIAQNLNFQCMISYKPKLKYFLLAIDLFRKRKKKEKKIFNISWALKLYLPNVRSNLFFLLFFLFSFSKRKKWYHKFLSKTLNISYHQWKQKCLLFGEVELGKGCQVKLPKQPNQFKLCVQLECAGRVRLFTFDVVRCHHLLHSLCPYGLISHKRLRKIGGS